MTHSGEQMPAIENRKNAPTWSSPCRQFPWSVKFCNVIDSKVYSTELVNGGVNFWRSRRERVSIQFASISQEMANQNWIVLATAFLADNCKGFKRIFSLPPIWTEFQCLFPFLTLAWETQELLWYLERNWHWWQMKVLFSMHMLLYCIEKLNWDNVGDLHSHNRPSSKASPQSEWMLKSLLCWAKKIPCLMFFVELCVSYLQLEHFLQRNLSFRFFGLSFDEGLF